MRTLILCLSLCFGRVAFADQPAVEILQFNVGLHISVCVNTGSMTVCSAEPSLGKNIEIPLETCEVAGEWSTCKGSYEVVRKIDGHLFKGEVNAVKTIYTNTVYYSLSANVNPMMSSQDPSHLWVSLNSDGTISNAVGLSGNSLTFQTSGGFTSYKPSLFIGPKGVSPNPRGTFFQGEGW